MFLRDRWYVIGFSADVPIGTPVACTVLGEPIALYRTASGTVAALEDRCSHRGAMLTAGGECRGELLQCPYHGIEFGPDGQCRRIPSQQHISPAMHIRSYPLAEHHGFLWIWVGDPAKKTAPPDHPWNDHPEWTAVTFHIVVEAGWQLLNDNLLDMTHAGYVHKKTIGNEDGDPHALAACTTTRDGDWVRVRRFMPNMDPPEFYKPMVDWKGRIDRWHEIDFTPSYHHFYVGGVDAGTGALEGVRDGGVQFHHLHGVTPINDHRTLYVFSLARNFRLNDSVLQERMEKILRATLAEDAVQLEAQQKNIDREPNRALQAIRSDAGGVMARRLIEEMISREARVALPEVAHVGDLAEIT